MVSNAIHKMKKAYLRPKFEKLLPQLYILVV